MFNLESITAYFAAQGRLHKSQRQTLAALVWALMRQPLLGIAAIGHRLAMAHTTTTQHAIKRVSHLRLDRSEDPRRLLSNLEYQCARPWGRTAHRLDDHREDRSQRPDAQI